MEAEQRGEKRLGGWEYELMMSLRREEFPSVGSGRGGGEGREGG